MMAKATKYLSMSKMKILDILSMKIHDTKSNFIFNASPSLHPIQFLFSYCTATDMAF